MTVRTVVILTRHPLSPQHYCTCLQQHDKQITWEMKCHAVVFSDENRFCLHASNDHFFVHNSAGRGRHSTECICSQHTGQIAGIIEWDAISYNAHLSFIFMEGMLNIAIYIQNTIQPIPLPLLHQEGQMLFQQSNSSLHVAHVKHFSYSLRNLKMFSALKRS